MSVQGPQSSLWESVGSAASPEHYYWWRSSTTMVSKADRCRASFCFSMGATDCVPVMPAEPSRWPGIHGSGWLRALHHRESEAP